MDINQIRAEVVTARWTLSQILKEIHTLKRSPQFRNLVGDVPSTIMGRGILGISNNRANVKGVVVTDNLARFRTKNWLSAEQVYFDYSTGFIYVGINPLKGARDLNKSTDERQVRVGELIAHGIAHFTNRAIDAAAAGSWDFTGAGPGEDVAVDITRGVSRHFGLPPLYKGMVRPFDYDPLYCAGRNLNNTNVPKFLSDPHFAKQMLLQYRDLLE